MDAIVINIEQFHSVNALNGREFGDKVLAAIGQGIRGFLADSEGIASRFEADQFDIYCQHRDDYQALLDQLQEGVNALSINASIRLRMGVAPWRRDVEPVLLFDRARAACNMVRSNYKTRLMVYDEEMYQREMMDQRLLNDLRRAMEERELTVYYQPKYNVQCDPPRLSSAEALIRWNHPELGMVPPGRFIPLFEGNGQISAVDGFVWNEAARQIAQWRKKYNFTVPVSVNLSRVDVFDSSLEERLEGLVEHYGLDHKALKLEVTESAYTDNSEQMIELINCLRARGFEIEMDDFGSGYSSLNMLSYMPIDVLKMDMQFVRNIVQSEKDFRLVQLVLDIAKYLKVPVVAEGVETGQQLDMLKGAGCDLVQGYYFSRPLPPEAFEELIEKEKKIERENET
jgi:EAL domain-containing protein (putative c-di-GMP-specific phosphodiesterase class I)